MSYGANCSSQMEIAILRFFFTNVNIAKMGGCAGMPVSLQSRLRMRHTIADLFLKELLRCPPLRVHERVVECCLLRAPSEVLHIHYTGECFTSCEIEKCDLSWW